VFPSWVFWNCGCLFFQNLSHHKRRRIFIYSKISLSHHVRFHKKLIKKRHLRVWDRYSNPAHRPLSLSLIFFSLTENLLIWIVFVENVSRWLSVIRFKERERELGFLFWILIRMERNDVDYVTWYWKCPVFIRVMSKESRDYAGSLWPQLNTA
jgi:hypothetical protein